MGVGEGEVRLGSSSDTKGRLGGGESDLQREQQLDGIGEGRGSGQAQQAECAEEQEVGEGPGEGEGVAGAGAKAEGRLCWVQGLRLCLPQILATDPPPPPTQNGGGAVEEGAQPHKHAPQQRTE